MTASPFDPSSQVDRLDYKVVAGLERISGAFRTLLWQQNLNHGLSPIQIQLLIFINNHESQYCKVSYLATEFNLAKPTISDSVKMLVKKRLIEKIPDLNDSRSYSIRPTIEGVKMAKHLATFSDAILQPISHLSETEQSQLWSTLVALMRSLQQHDIISLQRMCFSCANYRKDANGHYCKLLEQHLTQNELRIDCSEHELAQLS